MGRDVPYDADVECDNCGCVGSFDFMGDYLCAECFKTLQDGEEYCRHSVKCPSCGFTFSVSDCI